MYILIITLIDIRKGNNLKFDQNCPISPKICLQWQKLSKNSPKMAIFQLELV